MVFWKLFCKSADSFIGDGALDKGEKFIVHERLDISPFPGRKIIENDDAVSTVQESFDYIRPDKSCAAGYEISHVLLPL